MNEITATPEVDIESLPVVTPRVDVYEADHDDKQSLLVVADVPGASADGLSVRLEPGRDGDDVLSIEALASYQLANNQLTDTPDATPSLRYRRAFVLAHRVDADHIRARLQDGELRIELPRAAEDRRRRIPVVEA